MVVHVSQSGTANANAKHKHSHRFIVLFLSLVIVSLWFNYNVHRRTDLLYGTIPEIDDAPKENKIKVLSANEPIQREESPPPNLEVDWSDGMFGLNDNWERPVVIESHKLVFITVPKVGCSIFKQLFRRMMGYKDWFEKEPHDPSTNGLKYLGHYSRDKQLTMMTSPEWTRAIFVRDPMERALSSYLDKGILKNGYYVKQYCCGIKYRFPRISGDREFCQKPPFFPYNYPMNATNFSFEDFVNLILTDCDDVHFKPQHKSLDKASNWNFINFVGKFENRMEDTHSLLKTIGAFEEFGASGWGKFRNDSIFQTNLAGHQTGSSNKVDKHYTPSIRKRVYEHVRVDYELKVFNFTIPPDMESTL